MKARIRANLGLVALVIGAMILAGAVVGAWVMGDNQPVRWIETPIETPVAAPVKVDQ